MFHKLYWFIVPIFALLAACSEESSANNESPKMYQPAEGWMSDWEAAKAKSEETGKPILINFTGSDWCGSCVQVKKGVFSKDDFKSFAEKNLILMEVDFPKKLEVPEKIKKQNEELRVKYAEDAGYPAVFLLDSKGGHLSEDLGNMYDGTPEDWINALTELLEKNKTS